MKQKNKTKKGFTLLETLIAVFIFALAMVMISGAFANLLKNYAQAKKTQKNIENAEYAINLMAKTLRTSRLVVTNNFFPLRVFDYSQTSNNCIEYNYIDTDITVSSLTTIDTGCTELALLTGSSILANNITSSPSVTAIKTAGSAFGKITISMEVQDGASTIPIQMSVSLRQ